MQRNAESVVFKSRSQTAFSDSTDELIVEMLLSCVGATSNVGLTTSSALDVVSSLDCFLRPITERNESSGVGDLRSASFKYMYESGSNKSSALL